MKKYINNLQKILAEQAENKSSKNKNVHPILTDSILCFTSL